MKNLTCKFRIILSVLFIMQVVFLNAQTEYTISGKIADKNQEAVMFANIALLSCADSSILVGTVSGETGEFKIKYNKPGEYMLSASFIGFVPFRQTVKLGKDEQLNLKTIILSEKPTTLKEVVIKHERLKAKQNVDKTTYYVNSAMKANSNTGVDIVQNVPGVRVDLLQNISLNGSKNILILVNGIERDASFLAQLNSDKIDKIEIKQTPGVEYDAEISGVINLLLKEDANNGISGHIYANIPTSRNEVFSFPSASLNYTFDQLTLYSSYNGAFSFFDIETKDKRQFSIEGNTTKMNKTQSLFQENWSHKLHVGADYFYNNNNRLSVYGFVSRFSNEQSGNFQINTGLNEPTNNEILWSKDDDDINTSAYASVFYKHIFKKNAELSFDADYYMLKSENRLHLQNSTHEHLSSNSQAENKQLKARLSLQFPIHENISVKTGIEQKMNVLGDRLMPEFSYTENASAAYLSASFTKNKFQINTGIRAEYLHYLNNDKNRNKTVIMPSLHLKYNFENSKNIRFSYTKGINRPSVFQLNPNLQTLDHYTTQKGNAALKPSAKHSVNIDYSLGFGNSFLTTGLFYTSQKDVIETFTSIDDYFILRGEVRNLGNLSRLGMNTSGSFKLHKNISINPHIRLYYVQTQANEQGTEEILGNKKAIDFESDLSAIFLMKHNFAFSFSAQYKSRQTRIQHDYSEDVLYFVSIEKKFNDNFKIGITSAVPLKREFTYQAYEVYGRDFSQTTQDNIQMSMFPIWLKLNYTFASGKKTKRIERENSFNENRPKKGF